MCIDMDATFDRGSVGAGNVTRTNGLPSRWARLGTWKDFLRSLFSGVHMYDKKQLSPSWMPLIHKEPILYRSTPLPRMQPRRKIPIHSSTEDATAAEDTESGQASHIFLALLLDGARALWPSR